MIRFFYHSKIINKNIWKINIISNEKTQDRAFYNGMCYGYESTGQEEMDQRWQCFLVRNWDRLILLKDRFPAEL